MLLQRLIDNPITGFNYDYMGAAEYEYGATSHGRTGLARAWLEKDFTAQKVMFIETVRDRKSAPIEVLVMGRPETIHSIPAEF